MKIKMNSSKKTLSFYDNVKMIKNWGIKDKVSIQFNGIKWEKRNTFI